MDTQAKEVVDLHVFNVKDVQNSHGKYFFVLDFGWIQ